MREAFAIRLFKMSCKSLLCWAMSALFFCPPSQAGTYEQYLRSCLNFGIKFGIETSDIGRPGIHVSIVEKAWLEVAQSMKESGFDPVLLVRIDELGNETIESVKGLRALVATDRQGSLLGTLVWSENEEPDESVAEIKGILVKEGLGRQLYDAVMMQFLSTAKSFVNAPHVKIGANVTKVSIKVDNEDYQMMVRLKLSGFRLDAQKAGHFIYDPYSPQKTPKIREVSSLDYRGDFIANSVRPARPNWQAHKYYFDYPWSEESLNNLYHGMNANYVNLAPGGDPDQHAGYVLFSSDPLNQEVVVIDYGVMPGFSVPHFFEAFANYIKVLLPRRVEWSTLRVPVLDRDFHVLTGLSAAGLTVESEFEVFDLIDGKQTSHTYYNMIYKDES